METEKIFKSSVGGGDIDDKVIGVCSVHCKALNETNIFTGPGSAVGNMSGNRCESDCRSRGSEFDPGPVPYFHGD